MTTSLDRARGLIDDSRSWVALTGAGMSAESGVPTFRGTEGLWESFRPESLATPEAFRSDPRLVWEWYAWRRQRIGACSPHAGHLSLARRALGSSAEGPRIVTQNVDGLHTRAARAVSGTAGAGAAHPLELHGSVFRVRCISCRLETEHTGAVDASSEDTLPHCRDCGGLLRPAVVWFGESLDADVLGAAAETAGAADVCLVVGTSAVVHPAASIPLATSRAGGHIIEVNPEETPLSQAATVAIRGPAGNVLPALLD